MVLSVMVALAPRLTWIPFWAMSGVWPAPVMVQPVTVANDDGPLMVPSMTMPPFW